MDTKRVLQWLSVLILGVVIGAVIATAALSSATGLSFNELFIQGKLKETLSSLKEDKGSITKNVKIESDDIYTPVAAVAEKVQKSVVNIRTEKLEQYYDFFYGPFSEKVTGIGTGIIIRKDGYIVTNNHVISGASNITVIFHGGKEMQGRVVGVDPESDLAVVKVEAKNLPSADIGDSSKIKVGELAVAIGNPFGLSYTVSAGVISALHRNIQATDDSGQTYLYTNLIQTDAAINPGNSGGPLCNAKGEVIGINTLIYSRSGGYQGIGFAIPINDAMRIAEDLIKKGKASHAFIGIYGDDASKYPEKLPRGVKEGAIVVQVIPGSPAEKAGLQRGDIIVQLDGTPIRSMEDLVSQVRTREPGDKVKIVYYRNDEKREVEVVLEEKPVKTGLIFNGSEVIVG
ncbi:MAG: trypsin-like peptidase domain-containing protein [Actinobacteria bacterium]|nr:trypsin-like peptidase domain-containing protein [Actinomycetota bacterium]